MAKHTLSTNQQTKRGITHRDSNTDIHTCLSRTVNTNQRLSKKKVNVALVTHNQVIHVFSKQYIYSCKIEPDGKAASET